MTTAVPFDASTRITARDSRWPRIESNGRLIEKQHWRVCEDGGRDKRFLTHAFGEGSAQRVAFGCQTEAPQKLVRALRPITSQANAARDERQALPDRQHWVDLGRFGDRRNRAPTVAAKPSALKIDRTGIGTQQPALAERSATRNAAPVIPGNGVLSVSRVTRYGWDDLRDAVLCERMACRRRAARD